MNLIRPLAALILIGMVPPYVRAQRPNKQFEIQIGVEVPTVSLLVQPDARVHRKPGPSIGLLVYSNLESNIGSRLRGDFGISTILTTSGGFQGADQVKEFSLGLDVIPRIVRLAVGGTEARFYAGGALRMLIDLRDEIVEPVFAAVSGIGVVGRAGWFIRRTANSSLPRLDLSYQLGEFGGVVQHDLIFRVGFGN